jgi:hypothetical protein
MPASVTLKAGQDVTMISPKRLICNGYEFSFRVTYMRLQVAVEPLHVMVYVFQIEEEKRTITSDDTEIVFEFPGIKTITLAMVDGMKI